MTNALTTNISLSHWFHSWAQCFVAWKMPSVWVICPGCVPSQLPVYPQIICWWGRIEAKNPHKTEKRNLGAVQTLICNIQNSGVTNAASVPKSKHSRLWRKLNSSQPDPVQGLTMFCCCKNCWLWEERSPCASRHTYGEPDMSGDVYHCKPTHLLKIHHLLMSDWCSPCSLLVSSRVICKGICVSVLFASKIQCIKLYPDGPKLCSTAGKMHGGSWQGSTEPRVCGEAQSWAWLPRQSHRGAVVRSRSGSTARV